MTYFDGQGCSRDLGPEIQITVTNPITSETFQILALVDSGAYKTCIPRAQQRSLRSVPRTYRKVRGATGDSVRVPMVTVGIQLDGTIRDNIEVLLLDIPHALLGRDVLNDYKVTLDGRNKQWSVEPPW